MTKHVSFFLILRAIMKKISPCNKELINSLSVANYFLLLKLFKDIFRWNYSQLSSALDNERQTNGDLNYSSLALPYCKNKKRKKKVKDAWKFMSVAEEHFLSWFIVNMHEYHCKRHMR